MSFLTLRDGRTVSYDWVDSNCSTATFNPISEAQKRFNEFSFQNWLTRNRPLRLLFVRKSPGFHPSDDVQMLIVMETYPELKITNSIIVCRRLRNLFVMCEENLNSKRKLLKVNWLKEGF